MSENVRKLAGQDSEIVHRWNLGSEILNPRRKKAAGFLITECFGSD
jgi:hypothetical protein